MIQITPRSPSPLRAIRLRAGLTQANMAQILAISLSGYYGKESGKIGYTKRDREILARSGIDISE